jgi:hypothetical protein
MGWLISYDSYGGRNRAVFACRTPDCDVAEYDRDVIRRRSSVAPVPPAPRWQPRR